MVDNINGFLSWCKAYGITPTEYDNESLSYYQCLCKLTEKVSECITQVNENEEGYEQLQKNFTELKSFVDNYFDNLDVQDEIDKKLDEMVQSGELDVIFHKFIPYATPEMYGAVGDGVTDDTVAFQKAVNTGKNIILSGKYLITDQVLFSYSNVSICGGTIIAKNIPNKKDVFRISPTNNSNYYAFTNIIFDFTGINTGAGENGVLHFISSSGVKNSGCSVNNCYFHGNQSQDSSRKAIYFDNYNGAFTKEFMNNCRVYKTTINGANVGVANNRATVNICGCDISNTYWESITIDNGTDGCSVTQCFLGEHTHINGAGAIGIDNAKNTIISNNTFELGNETTTSGYTCISINSNVGTSSNLIIDSNICNGGYGSILVTKRAYDGLTNSTFSNNYFNPSVHCVTFEAANASTRTALINNNVISGDLLTGSGIDNIRVLSLPSFSAVANASGVSSFLESFIDTNTYPPNNSYHGYLLIYGSASPNSILGVYDNCLYEWSLITRANSKILVLTPDRFPAHIFNSFSSGSWGDFVSTDISVGGFVTTSLNNISSSGFYSFNNTTTGSPYSKYGCCVTIIGRGTPIPGNIFYSTQLAICTDNTVYIRSSTSVGVWGSWIELVTG